MPTKKTSSDAKVVETKKVKTEKPVKADKPAKAEKPAKVTAPAKTKTLKAEPIAEVSFNVTGKAAELIKKYQRNNTDTGSTEVQIALFTAKIDSLAKHLKKHAKDSDSKRGLLMMVGKRRRLLTYLQKNDQTGYENLIADLGLRK